MNKMIPIYTANNRAYTRDDLSEPNNWFSVQYWCIQGEDFNYLDLTPLKESEHALTAGRFAHFKKLWDPAPEDATKIKAIVTIQNANDIITWCGENLKNNWGVAIDEDKENDAKCINSVFIFADKDEAAFFKLSWG